MLFPSFLHYYTLVQSFKEPLRNQGKIRCYSRNAKSKKRLIFSYLTSKWELIKNSWRELKRKIQTCHNKALKHYKERRKTLQPCLWEKRSESPGNRAEKGITILHKRPGGSDKRSELSGSWGIKKGRKRRLSRETLTGNQTGAKKANQSLPFCCLESEYLESH